MPPDPTQTQDSEEQRRARQLSVERTRPPSEVPGYEPQRFLGAGAYGEVWVAVDRNTGRQVAIKFYSHRGGLQWPHLAREVEKLVFLSADRYVVQLLDVGWDAEPPFFVMEYIEQGSLDDALRRDGALPAARAVEIFREVALGLVHAHGRGVLHCDLKPANVLLDQDGRPRLADFGQSRLTHEQTPSLGTLFFMAPEQANLESVPEARWDVYALGALLYAMLTGAPPHRSPEALARIEEAGDLEQRLARYRQVIEEAPPPTAHRQLRDVDRPLAEILERCLQTAPGRRFPNPQAVLQALAERERRRARRPLVILGMIGPALLMLVMGLASWRGLRTVVRQSDEALTDRALESNEFAARYVARVAANELERRQRAVEMVARDPEFQQLLEELLNDPDLRSLCDQLNDPDLEDEELQTLRTRYRTHPARNALQLRMHALMKDEDLPDVASWFVNDPRGLQLARSPASPTIGRNYGWRTYFHGGPQDYPDTWRPGPQQHVQQTQLSAVFRSQATGRWIAGVSTPVLRDEELLGVIALTVEVGRFVELQGSAGQLAVLVDWRDGANKGIVLQHPLFEELVAEQGNVPDRFKDLRIAAENFPDTDRARRARYTDPLAADARGEAYRGRWLASAQPVRIADRDSGLRVIVQETHEHAIGPPLKQLQSSLLLIGLVALALVALVLTLLWGFVARVLSGSSRGANGGLTDTLSATPADTMATILDRRGPAANDGPTESMEP